eukprot:TRINITY_DN8999_c2_g1_i1.p1 TRINITY_DN8999_c2_g1~~TRINITY_DN8999_c2_g1_i1.p1  ORF type:complete len:121 (+),score=4.92 TRINITY_DN8999_c2_g1_i1:42-404(+)
MNTGEIYQSLLEDTQASLAAALSRIEVLKTRQRHLIHENNKLKQAMREAGIQQPVLSTLSSSFSIDPSQELPLISTNSQSQNQQQEQLQQQVQAEQIQHHVRGISDAVTEEEFVDRAWSL